MVEEIELRGNNLYRNGEVIDFGDGESILTRELIPFEGTVKDIYYTVRRDDRIDLIAYSHYSRIVEDSSKYWWVIADANNIHNPMDLEDLVGTEILIPNILNVLLKLQ